MCQNIGKKKLQIARNSNNRERKTHKKVYRKEIKVKRTGILKEIIKEM
jgi:hypothetical protein